MAPTCPEAELLLACARTQLDPARAAWIRAAAREPLDWVALLRMAQQHRLTLLLYWHLHTVCPEAAPTAAMDQLRDHFHAHTRRNLFLTGELLSLLTLFKAHQIAAIPFKGPALAAGVYGNLALRQFDDLDLLIHPQDVQKARDLLVSQGYQPQFHLTDEQEAAFLEFRCARVFTRNGVILDLHWALMPKGFSFSPATDCAWTGLEPRVLTGTTVPHLGQEDLLLLLCMHGAKHEWTRLEWICDVAELIRAHPAMNWRRLIEQADALRSTRMLFLGLFLARDLLAAALPEDVWQRVTADPQVRSLAVQVRAMLFREANDRTWPFGRHTIYLSAMERLRDRGRFWFDLMMTPTTIEWALLPLPPMFFPLYYALRPIRLIGKYGQRLWKRPA